VKFGLVFLCSINIAVAGFWARVQWWYAAKDHRLTDPDLEPTFIKIMSRRGTIGIVIYLIATALSIVSIVTSLVLFIVIPIYYLVPAQTDKPWLWFTRNRQIKILLLKDGLDLMNEQICFNNNPLYQSINQSISSDF
jgi:hypothetical protein